MDPGGFSIFLESEPLTKKHRRNAPREMHVFEWGRIRLPQVWQADAGSGRGSLIDTANGGSSNAKVLSPEGSCRCRAPPAYRFRVE
jgi:hypothetical protein